MSVPIEYKRVRLFQTVKATSDRLTEKDIFIFQEDNAHWRGFLNVYPEVRYQRIEGFGGAFTEAAAVTWKQLPLHLQQIILDAYFDPVKGFGYSLCRTHINSCDFSLENYNYVKEHDDSLSSFSIFHDQKALIPFIQQAMCVKGANFRLFASPWSPPGWMKTTGTMNFGGTLLPQYRATWAKYIAKYIRAYREQGLPIWGITVQNEPAATQVWDSCNYSAQEEAEFVRDFLAPELDDQNLSDIAVMVWDHNKDALYRRAKEYFKDDKVRQRVWGMAFHWYSGDHFGDLEAVFHEYPEKSLLFTEGTIEGGVKLDHWASGEHYGHHMIGDLNHHACGFIDWNLLLDQTGGPNHVGNYCDAPIIADLDKKQIHFQPSFYYIGHVAKFVRPGAVRVGCSVYRDDLETVAFVNADESLVIVVMNRTEQVIPYLLSLHQGETTQITSPPHSIQTIILYRI